MIIGIVAIAKNYAIGKGGKLPWRYPADLKFFRKTTDGNAVVMGANTWRSIGKPLPGRLNVILSRTNRIDAPAEVMRLACKEEVIELAKYLDRDVFIIGGAKTYKEFSDVIERWIVTDVPIDVEKADVFLPIDIFDGFKLVETRDLGDGLAVRMSSFAQSRKVHRSSLSKTTL